MEGEQAKDLLWIGSSKRDFKEFPAQVQDDFGHELWGIQLGDIPDSAKALRGFGGISVLELTNNYDSDTYRVVCIIHFRKAAYVLHAFMKKAKRGIQTPQKEMNTIMARIDRAAQDYARRYGDDRRER